MSEMWPEVFTDADLAAFCRISRRQLQRLAAEQQRTGRALLPPTLPYLRCRRYLREDVFAWAGRRSRVVGRVA